MAVASLGVVAQGSAFSPSTLVLPITVDVPRSDPSTGATWLVMFEQSYYTLPGSPGGAALVSDDAPMDSFYNTCYYSDGLNHYGIVGLSVGPVPFNNYNTFATTDVISPKYTRTGGGVGAIVFNPLLNGVNNITLTFGTPAPAYYQCFVVAYTGLQLAARSQNTPPELWHASADLGGYMQKVVPLSGGTTQSGNAQWVYNQILGGGSGPNVIGPPFLETPGRAPSTPTPYPDFEFQSPGDLLIGCVADVNHGAAWGAFNPVAFPVASGDFETGSSGAWGWGGPFSTVHEIDDADPLAAGFPLSIAYGEAPAPALPGTVDLTGAWAGIQPTYTFGSAAILVAGGGPPQCVPPPPSTAPLLNNRFRAA